MRSAVCETREIYLLNVKNETSINQAMKKTKYATGNTPRKSALEFDELVNVLLSIVLLNLTRALYAEGQRLE